jgi:hypothetical protein
MTTRLTYQGKPLSYLYAEYADRVRAAGGAPLPLAEWVHDPAHSPQFRAAFQVADPTSVR